jgi:hypothetical protein
MTITNRNQRVALKRVYDRGTLWAKDLVMTTVDSAYGVGKPLTYKEFRKKVSGTFGMDGAVIVPWCGMWLAIERDGYVHS